MATPLEPEQPMDASGTDDPTQTPSGGEMDAMRSPPLPSGDDRERPCRRRGRRAASSREPRCAGGDADPASPPAQHRQHALA